MDIIDLALTHIGEKYVLGALTPKNKKNYKGPWDCAEFISHMIYETYGFLYGCSDNSASPENADAWTNFFKRDVETLGIKISIDEAKRTRGAILLRYTVGSSIGHIVFSQGDGTTIEAMGSKYGVKVGSVDGRRWDTGILLPNVIYKKTEAINGVDVISPYSEPAFKVFRKTSPMMIDPLISDLQKALTAKGFNTKGVDGKYGNDTMNAVLTYQLANGLVGDGEAGSEVFKKLGLL